MLSLAERYEHDGVVKGATTAVDRALELIKKGIDPEKALLEVRNIYESRNEQKIED